MPFHDLGAYSILENHHLEGPIYVAVDALLASQGCESYMIMNGQDRGELFLPGQADVILKWDEDRVVARMEANIGGFYIVLEEHYSDNIEIRVSFVNETRALKQLQEMIRHRQITKISEIGLLPKAILEFGELKLEDCELQDDGATGELHAKPIRLSLPSWSSL